MQVWISTAEGAPNANGGYVAFWIADETQQVEPASFIRHSTALTLTAAKQSIFERPELGGGKLAQLSDYEHAYINSAWA